MTDPKGALGVNSKQRVSQGTLPVQRVYEFGPTEALIARHAAVQYPYGCVFGEAQLIIEEGVFCPTFTNVSPLLLRSVQFSPGQRVLDMFAGCGAFGIVAALRGARVVTIDISADAVACTLSNAALNNVEDKVDARIGTLADCVDVSEAFDVVVANPPLLPGEPSDTLTAALFDPGLRATIDLVASLPRILSPTGKCFLVTSDVADRVGCNVEGMSEALGLHHTYVDSFKGQGDVYRVHLVQRPSGAL